MKTLLILAFIALAFYIVFIMESGAWLVEPPYENRYVTCYACGR